MELKWGRCFLLLIAGILGIGTNVFGAANSWTWGASGFWSVGTNWSLGAPGTNSSQVQINNSGLSKTVILDTSGSPTNLTINGLLVASAGSKTNWLVVSNLTAANPLLILAGASVGGSSASQQGRFVITNSTVILDGTNGSGLSVSNGLVILQPGGELLLTNGATAVVGNGASGALNVTTNSAFRVALSNLVVGNDGGAGTMTVSGGTVDVGWTFSIGETFDATGTVVVTSGLLRAVNTNANAEIGQDGGGLLILSNGVCQFDDVSVGRHDGAVGNFRMFNGLCEGSDLSVGRFTNALGFFTMSGGQLIFNDGIYAGREGRGTISVTNGSIQARELLAGCTNGSFGTATFLGGTSLFSSMLCLGGLRSTGNVSILGGIFACTNSSADASADIIGGTLAIGGGANVFLDSVINTNSRGKIVITGGVVTASQFAITNGSRFVLGNGVTPVTLRLRGGTSIFANGLTVASNAILVGSGAIYGNVLNSGTIIADATNTPLTFYGSVTNSRTMLQTNGGTFDFRGALVNNGSIVPKVFPRNTIARAKIAGTTNEIFFTTTNGFTYTLEVKTLLSDPGWIPLGTVAGNNATNSLLDTNGGGLQRFYRIRIQ